MHKYNARITEAKLHQLKALVDARPDMYLDEVACYFGMKTGKYVCPSTIWKYITCHLNYPLQSLSSSIASQQCFATRVEFQNTLGSLLLNKIPELLIIIDETHKDWNAARTRRWRYGEKNCGGLKLNAWYKSVVRYTMIGVTDVNGFIASACETYEVRQANS